MLVMVSVPYSETKVWPTAVTATPLMNTAPSPSGASITMVPTVVSLGSGSLVPAGSSPRRGRPDSSTEAEASTAPSGLSSDTTTTPGSRSSAWGMTSSSGSGARSKVEKGSSPPRSKAAWMSPGSTAKLPPELCGAPAAGWGSLPVSRAARLSAGMTTPATAISGTKTAPSGTTIRVPSDSTSTMSRPCASTDWMVTSAGSSIRLSAPGCRTRDASSKDAPFEPSRFAPSTLSVARPSFCMSIFVIPVRQRRGADRSPKEESAAGHLNQVRSICGPLV